MDPLSITISCVVVIGASGAATKGLKKLRDLMKVPEVLLSIMNEIADLTLVVQDIRFSFHFRKPPSNISQASISIIHRLLNRA